VRSCLVAVRAPLLVAVRAPLLEAARPLDSLLWRALQLDARRVYIIPVLFSRLREILGGRAELGLCCGYGDVRLITGPMLWLW